MAISMNNHESRIKALETTSSMKSSITKIWSGDVLFSGSINLGSLSAYKILIIVGGDGTTLEDYVPIPITGETMNFQMGDYVGRTVHSINTSTGVISYTGTYYGSAHGNNKFHRIYGLKIYYIFRYNIYNKIILRIISKINHFFTKIFKYGGEIRDGY